MDGFNIRRAVASDAETLAQQRCAMFAEMGRSREDSQAQLLASATTYMSQAVAAGQFVAFLATPSGSDRIVGGGGMVLQDVPPRINRSGDFMPLHQQGLILSVYVEPEWRRRGIARAIMERLIEHARESRLKAVVLHASEAGRSLYEQLGFEPTSEMRLYL